MDRRKCKSHDLLSSTIKPIGLGPTYKKNLVPWSHIIKLDIASSIHDEVDAIYINPIR